MFVGLVVGVLALLAIPASPASAHATLVSSDPAGGSVVTQAPGKVVLTFTEGVQPVSDRVHVIAPDGSTADSGTPTIQGDQMIIPMKPGAPQGTFLVNYRVISADSHPIGGAFTYSVGAPSPGGPPTAANAPDQTPNRFISAAFPVARWMGYVGLLLLVGAVLVLALLWPKRLDRRDPNRVIWIGAGMVALSAVLELAIQVPYVAGGGLGNVRAVDVREVISSQYGAAHLVRLGVLAAAMVLIRPIARGKGWGADRVLLAVLGAIGVGTWSVSGHPSATSVPMVTVVADMIHVASMSVWLGGLIMLIAFLLPRASGRELAAIVPIWSRWAAYAVSALVLTGVAQALIEIGTLSSLVNTTYGWLVLAKAGLALVAVAVASQSRRLVPRIASGVDTVEAADADETEDGSESETLYAATAAAVGSRSMASTVDGGGGSTDRGIREDDATDDNSTDDAKADGVAHRRVVGRLRGLVVAETVIAAVILGTTSVLVQTTPARSADTQTVAAPSVQSATMKDKLFILSVDVQPATVGLNDVHMYASTPDGQPATIKEWTVKASAPDLGIEPISANVLGIEADHAIGQIGIPKAGTWTFTFTLRTTEIDESTVTAQIVVKP